MRKIGEVLVDSITSIESRGLEISKYMLEVGPNPFRHTTNIRYTIHDVRSTMQNPKLGIYDATGRLVKSFNHESCIMDHGSAISWDGTDQNNRRLGSGVYFVTLQAGDYTATEKLLLIR